MARRGFVMKLRPNFAVEYRHRHDEIWPELAALLKNYGISDYSIFLQEETNTLFGVMTFADIKLLDGLPEEPIMKKWWAYMQDIMETNPDHSPVSTTLEEVFHLP
jgi:L-rhamnose mutarotase